MPDQHAAFGITRAMAGIVGNGVGGARGIGGSSGAGFARVGGGVGAGGSNGRGTAGGSAGAFWRDLGLEEIVERGPTGMEDGGGGVGFLAIGDMEKRAPGVGVDGRVIGRRGDAVNGNAVASFRREEPEQPIALAIRDKKRADDVRAR